jgi:zinc protease
VKRHSKLLPLVAALALGGACVTTEHQAGAPDDVVARGPDPRAHMPKLEQRAVALEKKPAAPQGMRVVTTTDPGDPLVNLRLLFLTGSRHDPAGKEGLTQLSARLMAEGTQALSATELRGALFPWAAELSVQVDKETTVFIGRVHRDHLDGFTRILLDVVLRPRLDAADFDRLRAESLSYLESDLRQGDDEALQREALEIAIFDQAMARPAPPAKGGAMPGPGKLGARHPYRHTPTGTVSGLKAITLDDVRAHIAQAFNKDRLVLGVGGGASDAYVAQVRTQLEALPGSKASAPALPPVAAPFANRALLIDKKAPGSAISVGYHVKLDRAHPDYPAMKVAESFFGEHRNRVSWLFQAMREQRGLNYGDYAYVEHFVQQGWGKNEKLNIGRRHQYFSIWIRPVEHKNRHFALRQTVYELDRFVQRGIPDDESFKRLLTFLLGHWQQKEQEPMRKLGYAMDDAFYGTGYDRDGLRERVLKLTRADVNAAIKRHLRADKLHIVVVTEGAAQLAKDLVANTPSAIEYAAAKPQEILDEDKTIERFDLKLTERNVRVVPSSEMFEN